MELIREIVVVYLSLVILSILLNFTKVESFMNTEVKEELLNIEKDNQVKGLVLEPVVVILTLLLLPIMLFSIKLEEMM